MKLKQLKIIATTGLVVLLTVQETSAQQGMDYGGLGGFHYARLRRANSIFMENNNNEKAMGVYTNEINPSSMLEVNTTNAYSPLIHPNLAGDRGLVFRTVAPVGFTQQWQMFRDNNQIARLFNTANNNFQLEATQGNMLFNTAGPTPGTIRERIRIMQSPGFQPGVTNVTRVGINYGATPIGIPVAMLHLGNSLNIASATRNWMDVGTFYNLDSDHMYVGLKDEGGGIGDRMDAVINWGNNFIDQPTGHGPDFLRFIFNDGLISSSNDPRESQDGLEVARFDPQLATTLAAPNYGMMGIGNFSPTGPNTAATDVVNAKLDIDGDLRIRTVTQNDALTQILAIDPTDKNRVHWVDAANFTGGGGGTVTSDNGLSIDPLNPSNVQLGNDVGLTTAQLINDREIPMNGNNIMFNDNANSVSSIGIGHPLGTNSTVAGKFEVNNDSKTIGGSFNTNSTSNANLIGVFANSLNNGNGGATGVRGVAQSTLGGSTGVRGVSLGGSVFAVGVCGVSFSNSPTNVGVDGLSRNATNLSIGGNFDVTSSNSPQNIGIQTDLNNGTNASSTNYGVQILMNTIGNTNYGIFSNVSGGTTNWAGWFNGNVFISGTFGPSDAVLKTNVESIDNAMDVVTQLNPVSFDFDNSVKPRLNLQQGKQYGLIAQEVELILPEMVGSTILPAEYDSLGNETDPSFEFKTIDYERFVPLLIAGMNEQQTNLNTKDSLISSLESRLTYLENCIRNANICTEGNRTMNTEPSNTTNNRSVELVNTNSLILQQNLPNPFKENTVINYNIPTEISEAKLLFYDLNGRIIKEFIIDERGESKLTVYGTNLKTGVYTYSLIADGELIATKKMVKK